jgi:methyltransferase
VLALLFLAVGFIALQRLLELGLARRNERWVRSRGAVERGSGHYPVIVAVHVSWLAAVLVEGWWRGPELSALWPLWLGLFLAAQALRYWSIASLGRMWNTRILVIPGARPVRKGPYRYFPHPNYVAVVIELFTVPAIFGAWVTAVLFSVLNALVLVVRIRTEERALAELAGGRRVR